MRLTISGDYEVRTPSGDRLPPEDQHDFAGRLMTALLDGEEADCSLAPPGIGSDAGPGVVTVDLLVTADEEGDAVRRYLAEMGTAGRAAGTAVLRLVRIRLERAPACGEAGDEVSLEDRGRRP